MRVAPRLSTSSIPLPIRGDLSDAFDLNVSAVIGGSWVVQLVDPATDTVLATDSDLTSPGWDAATPNTGAIAPDGTVDTVNTVSLVVDSDLRGTIADTALDEISVVDGTVTGSGVLVVPDNSSVAFAGDSIAYTHTITNNSGATRTFDLSTASFGSGFTSTIYRDSNGDGIYTEGVDVAIISTPSLANGESTRVFVVVDVPGGASAGEVDVTQLFATFFDDNGTPTDPSDDTTIGGSATDTTTVIDGSTTGGFDLSGGGTKVVDPSHTQTPGDGDSNPAVYPGTLTSDQGETFEVTISPSTYANGTSGSGDAIDDLLDHTTQLVVDTTGDGVPDTVIAEDTDGDGIWDLIDVDGDGALTYR